jgi:hypothetical protein
MAKIRCCGSSAGKIEAKKGENVRNPGKTKKL